MNINKYLIIFFLISNIFACKNSNNVQKYITLQGETMGTYYSIKYKGNINLQQKIDQELIRINQELSTYIPTSTISLFNQSDTGIIVSKSDLWLNVLEADKIFTLSSGFYDPTVMPLVNYWGFGYKEHNKVKEIDSLKIIKILNYIGFNKIQMINSNKDSIFIKKPSKEVQLDFSSIAKGYGVDKIAQLIRNEGVKDFLIEIGGELVCDGLSPSNKKWVVGINTPEENASTTELIYKKQLSGKALATSGNYRNFYNVNGHKYSHTINPKTGFPEISNLLSVTIIAPSCMTADALATACMVSGLEKSIRMINKLDSIEACLIYLNDKKKMEVYFSDGFEE
jgi:thiamine biosynthesis lipoprotein